MVNLSEQFIASMPTGLVVVDAKLHATSMNPLARAMFCRGDDEMILGKPICGTINAPDLIEPLKQVLATGASHHNLVVPTSLETAIRYFEFNISRAELGGNLFLLLTVQEITERILSQEKNRRFCAALDNSIDAILLYDCEDRRVIDANDTASQILGYSYEELVSLGPQDLRADLADTAVENRFDEIIQSDGRAGMHECVYRRKDGSQLPVEVYMKALESDGKNVMIATVRDISSRLRADRELHESEERFRVAFNQAAVGLAHIAPDGRWLRVNQKLCEITGYAEEELLKRRFQEITHPDDMDADRELLRRSLEGEISNYTREKRYRRKNGGSIWINVTSSLIRDQAGQPRYYSVVIEDITRRKVVEEELQFLANHDALSGLPNRLSLHDRLSAAIANAGGAGRHVAVMFVDLDRLKFINDRLGHEVGDRVIVEVGRRLSSRLRDGDTVSRLGGDEFVVVLADLPHEDGVAAAAARLLESLSRPMHILGQELFNTCSIGISLYPKDGLDEQTLLKNADVAMYRAKDSGGNNFQFYAADMNLDADTVDRLKLEGDLRRALEREEFVLHYQPQIDLTSGRLVGVEALLRWMPPGRALVSPADFIPIAEETGLIVPIGEWVLRTACTQNQAWQAAGFPAVRMAVNLSARQFKQQNIVNMVSQVLQETGCCAGCLELEITESVLMDKPEAAAAVMRELNEMGVHLSIDDFGTGYSSLSYLKRFPISSLKIDQSFVKDISTDADDAAIVKAVIALAHSMKLSVIAEGVETAAQLDFLRAQKCDQMQGYYFSPPVPPEQIEKLLLNQDDVLLQRTA